MKLTVIGNLVLLFFKQKLIVKCAKCDFNVKSHCQNTYSIDASKGLFDGIIELQKFDTTDKERTNQSLFDEGLLVDGLLDEVHVLEGKVVEGLIVEGLVVEALVIEGVFCEGLFVKGLFV